MACRRRALTAGFTHVYRRLHPSFAYVLPDRRECSDQPTSSSFGHGHGSFSNCLGLPLPLGADQFLRHRSYSSGEIGPTSNVSEVLTDAGIGEVAAAAADSYAPVAALQHLIDGVHSIAGVNWWAAIALTTVLIRCTTVPFLLNQMRSTIKLNEMRPEIEKLKEQIQNSTDPDSLRQGRKQMTELFKKHGVTPFTPLKGIFIQGPIFISFFFAISNMAEKVPSFKAGGLYWFTDLTTPDPLYALPVLTGLTFLATVELNMQDGMEGNPVVNTMKNLSRVLAFATVPLTASFPKAIFCYWITANIFSLTYGFILRHPLVRKFLNLPKIATQAAPASQPNFSFLGGSKLLSPPPSPIPAPAEVAEPSKLPARSISSSAVNQRIRNLEKNIQVQNKSEG